MFTAHREDKRQHSLAPLFSVLLCSVGAEGQSVGSKEWQGEKEKVPAVMPFIRGWDH